jgi:hypothetical protein
MKRILVIAFAVFAVTIMTDSSANAQGNMSGYGFGVGVNQAQFGGGYAFGGNRGFGGLGLLGPFNSVRRVEEPPYFAKFPPVYYSGIVKRPYGISPYAAPAGIAPVEMSIPVPTTVKNKYFHSNVAPVSKAAETKQTIESTEDKSTSAWVSNPYIESLAAQ